MIMARRWKLEETAERGREYDWMQMTCGNILVIFK